MFQKFKHESERERERVNSAQKSQSKFLKLTTVLFCVGFLFMPKNKKLCEVGLRTIAISFVAVLAT